MAKEYITKEGEMLDQIAFRHYGHHKGTVAVILDANRELSNEGMTLPAGIKIILPDFTSTAIQQPIRLWD